MIKRCRKRQKRVKDLGWGFRTPPLGHNSNVLTTWLAGRLAVSFGFQNILSIQMRSSPIPDEPGDIP